MTTTETTADSAAERIKARRDARQKGDKPGDDEHKPTTILGHIRGWADALFFAFLLAMFIRTYVFELFMIPTGSMTPTLIGDDARLITEYDWNNDGLRDIVALPGPTSAPDRLQVHLRGKDGKFTKQLEVRSPGIEARQKFADHGGPGKGRRDMILVNKFAYWFSPPDYGDIAIFKVPDRPEDGYSFDPTKPVYIKRCAGRPGDTLTFSARKYGQPRPPGDPLRETPAAIGGIEFELLTKPILVNGKPLTVEPFPRLHHFTKPPENADTAVYPLGPDGVMMVGDNQMSSSDSRYWGVVPQNHMRGKAVLRYFPIREFGILTPDS